jgi:hypothetical protein
MHTKRAHSISHLNGHCLIPRSPCALSLICALQIFADGRVCLLCDLLRMLRSSRHSSQNCGCVNLRRAVRIETQLHYDGSLCSSFSSSYVSYPSLRIFPCPIPLNSVHLSTLDFGQWRGVECETGSSIIKLWFGRKATDARGPPKRFKDLFRERPSLAFAYENT